MNIRSIFVVPIQQPKEPLEEYLRRTLEEYHDYLTNYIGLISQGHPDVLEVDSTESYDIVTRPEHRITYLTVIASPGSYTFTLNFLADTTQDNKDGDIVQIYMKQIQAGVGPTILINDQDSNLLYQKDFDGSTEDSEFTQFIVYKSQWIS